MSASTFELDPAVAARLMVIGGDRPPPVLPVGDVESRRVTVGGLQQMLHAELDRPADVAVRTFRTRADDGAELALHWFHQAGTSPGSAVLYLHGGGMIMGSVALYDAPIARHVAATGVPFLAVEYRYAPEFPHPVPASDCYAALMWLAGHAESLGVDPGRIAVMGDSGGGGLAAAVAILVRDRSGPAPARQILVYPMLDDRTTEPDPAIASLCTWSYEDNATGWGALLGAAAGGPDVAPSAAPARLTDFSGLAPAYIEVGAIDVFRDECVGYARRLLAAGVDTELHVVPGAPHAFDAIAPAAAVSLRVVADRNRVISDL
ncbi:alpha/beta hydrolase [Pseudonocardia kongjuensis]|uniref:Alpha/beta hydrolase n=2 Tax=Pseudonocardia kongjuensis TaxID=102227 RepID=A0ABN1XN15_9PSEU